MADVGDVDPKVVVTIIHLPSDDGIIQVLGLDGVNRDQRLVGDVLPALLFLWQDVHWDLIGLLQRFLRELVRNIVGVDD